MERTRNARATATFAGGARTIRPRSTPSFRWGDAVIGKNIYIQRKEPRIVPEYDRVHVAKLSAGWKAHFDGSSAIDNEWEPLDEHAPRIGSMDDLRGYLSTGEWELIDEYGEKTTLEEVLAHDDVMRDGKPFNTEVSLDDYRDREGYPWSRREFC